MNHFNCIRYIEELYLFDKDGNIKDVFTENNGKFRKKCNNEDEIKTIIKLQKKLKCKIYKLREIDYPLGIRTPDIKIITKDGFEYWDIKNIKASKTLNSHNNKIHHVFDKGKTQTSNFVIDITSKECSLSNNEAYNQVIKLLRDYEYYNWINKVIIIGNHNFFRLIKVNKKNTHQRLSISKCPFV